jgi:cell division protein FtsL
MMSLKSKKSVKRPWRLIGIGLLCSVMAFTLIPRITTVVELSQRQQSLLAQKAALEQEQQRLQIELEKADSPENIERLAREQLGMVKPGEQRLIPVLTR